MKNYLIITLGTSEVQVIEDKLEENGFSIASDKKSIFRNETPNEALYIKENRNRTGTYLFDKPRIGGEFVIENNLEKFIPIFDFPLVLPAVELFFKENSGKQIDKCLLVFTDQDDPKFRDSDTINFKTILKEKLKTKYGFNEHVFMEFPISKDVTKIDFQYADFAKRCKAILETPEDEIEQVVLLTQGGIDQINQALTLQFIQAYKHKLKLYQKAEGRAPEVLKFPQLFLRDLNKQKIIKHLEDYDFKLIDKSLTDNEDIVNLAKYASMRLFLQHNKLHQLKHKLQNFNFLTYEQNDQSKLTDLFLAAKIDFHRKNYYDLLWRLYTLNENILRVKCESILGRTDSFMPNNDNPRNENVPWISFLNSKNPQIVPELRKKGIWLDKPSPKAFSVMLPILFPGDSTAVTVLELNMKLGKLSKKRNEIAHQLATTDENQINQLLDITNQYKIENLIGDLGKYFGIQKPFGIFDDIKAQIEELL